MDLLNDPKIKAAMNYQTERMSCRNTDGSPFYRLEDIDVTAFMCGWDACMKHVGIQNKE